MDGILDEMVQGHERDLTQAYVEHVFSDVDPLDYDAILEIVNELRREFGHLIDSPEHPGLLTMRWKELLKYVSEIVTNMNSQVGRQ